MVLVSMVCLIPCFSHGVNDYYETNLMEGTVIGENIEFIEDSDGRLSLHNLLNQNLSWEKNKSQVFNRGYSKSTWWLRFHLTNPNRENKWLLEFAYSVLDSIDVYLIYPYREPTAIAMGDKLPFSARPIPHRFFVVPFELPQNESVTIYLKISSASAIQVPMSIWDGQTFHHVDSVRNLTEGFYFGGLAIIGLYNLLLFLVLGGRVYLYYLANVSGIFLFVACLHGWGFQYLWPEAIDWNNASTVVFLSVLLASSWAFSGAFLETPKISRLFYVVHYVSLSYAIILIPVAMVISYRLAISITIPFALLSCVWGFVSGFKSWQIGNSSARYYLIAWSMFLVGGVVMALNKYDLIPGNLITDSAIQIGSLLDVLLFSLALAERINKERTLRFEAQKQALVTQQSLNEKLESRVAARTKELELANQMLQEISDTDQLTGLKNRRFLEKVLSAEFTRAYRYQRPIAVLLIDADRFKQINDNFGHLVGDTCLCQIAKRITQVLRRPSDLACRYGGEEFCVVLPELDHHGAMIVAENIRKNVESSPIVDGDFSASLTVSIGVYAAIPKDNDSVIRFFGAADNALYEAKALGRNRVVQRELIVGDTD